MQRACPAGGQRKGSRRPWQKPRPKGQGNWGHQKDAIVIHSDYSKSKGGYTGSATSEVTIQGVVISGLSGTATNLYDIVANPKVVSDWTFSDITVSASSKGSCSGQPSSIAC
ncbi:Polygalacturonase [Phytophthora palmivora]|uniref:Polygalacturonase n=1 Tax=Phytophthora palmivora TaxID=4796 RepID=A0A2P4YP71_9STRA|nr:Polygalacturonase [Phytophthora palmivora]